MHTSATHRPTHSARTVIVEVCLYHNKRNKWANQHMDFVKYADQMIIMATTMFLFYFARFHKHSIVPKQIIISRVNSVIFLFYETIFATH